MICQESNSSIRKHLSAKHGYEMAQIQGSFVSMINQQFKSTDRHFVCDICDKVFKKKRTWAIIGGRFMKERSSNANVATSSIRGRKNWWATLQISIVFISSNNAPSNKFPLVFENSMKKLVKSKGCRVQMKLVGLRLRGTNEIGRSSVSFNTYQFHLYPAAFRFDEFFHGIFLI